MRMTQHGQVGVPGSTAALAATSLEFETPRNARRAAAKAGARLSSRAQHGLKVIQAENGFRTDGAKSGQIAQTSKEGARRARTLGHAGAGFTCRVDVLAPSEASPLQPLSGLLSVDRGGSAGRLLAHELEKHQTPEQKEFEPTAREIFAAHQASAFWGERLDRPVRCGRSDLCRPPTRCLRRDQVLRPRRIRNSRGME